MYVQRGNVLVNARMLQEGMARVAGDITRFSRRAELVDAENFARLSNIGIWQVVHFAPPQIIRHHERVNINTAPIAFLMTYVFNEVVPAAERATFVVRFNAFRNASPFGSIYELRFVPGVTREMFSEIRHQISVVTDMNTASRHELLSLGMNERIADMVLEYREERRVETLYTMFEYLGLPHRSDRLQRHEWLMLLFAISPFVITDYEAPRPIARPANFTVNINTASRTMLMQTGLTPLQADRVIMQRDHFSIKTLFELSRVPGLWFADAQIHALSDNLTTITDINTATENEIRSLFNVTGFNREIATIMNNRPFTSLDQVRSHLTALLPRFNEIEQFVKIGGIHTTTFVNANTATVAQLMNVGFTSAQAIQINSHAGRMLIPQLVPAAARAQMHRLTLVTNINTASPSELDSLGSFMSDALISEIIFYRNDQPFGCRDEIQDFFEERGMLVYFRQIEWFINVR